MIGCLVRNAHEVRSALHGTPAPNILLGVSFEALQSALASGSRAVLLDESLISRDHRSINRWAYDFILERIDQLRSARPEDADALNANFYEARTEVIRTVKWVRVINALIQSEHLSEVRFYDDTSSPLGGVLQAAAAAGLLSAPVRCLGRAPSLRQREERSAVRRAMDALWRIRSRLALDRLAGCNIFSGAITHLGPLAEALSGAADERITFVESAYSRLNADYCRRNKFDYRVLRLSGSRSAPLGGRPLLSPGERALCVDGMDYAAPINAVFDSWDRVERLNRGFDIGEVRRLLRTAQPARVILDEDSALRRPLALEARRSNIPCFVVSHGVPQLCMLGALENDPKRYVASAKVLVNSEYEKKAYRGLFIDPANVEVTGVPRFDRGAAPSAGNNKKLTGEVRVLFCGASLIPYEFEKMNVINSHLGGSEAVSLEAERYFLTELFKILKRPAEVSFRVSVKTKYSQRETSLRMVSALKPTVPCEVFGQATSITGLIADADIVITPPSTVITEAVRAGKRTIVVNLGDPEPTREWDVSGCVRVVRDGPGLDQALNEAIRPNILNPQPSDYFTGPTDGQNTQRALRAIFAGKRSEERVYV